jgi:hypothetical protein
VKGITARDLMPHLAEKGRELSLKPGEAVRRLKAMRVALVRLAKETGDETYRRDVMAIDQAIEALDR